MFTRKFFGLGIIFLILSAAFNVYSAQQAKTIVLATDPEKKGGVLIELTVAAFKKVGYEVEVRYMPWARVMLEAFAGRVDGAIGSYYTDERAEKLWYSDVVIESPEHLFARKKDAIKFAGLESLKPYSIGTIIGVAFPKEFAEATYLHKEPVSDFKQNIRRLQTHRIDLFEAKKSVCLDYIKNEMPESVNGIVALEPPLWRSKYYTVISRKAADPEQKLNDFNRGLAKIRADGTYGAIMARNLHE
jgi:polar amino acid transport system substrate-binding protein